MAQNQKSILGYPHIEKLIDSEDFDEMNRAFKEAYDKLKEASKQKGLRRSREAKKAMKAFEKVAELLKELLQVKYRLQEEMAKRRKQE